MPRYTIHDSFDDPEYWDDLDEDWGSDPISVEDHINDYEAALEAEAIGRDELAHDHPEDFVW